MATTVIDELIVTLGLDPTKFKKGQKDAADELITFRRGVGQAAADVEDKTSRMATGFATVQSRVLRLAALFLGGLGLESWVSHIVPATAQLGRFSSIVNMSSQELYAWQKAGGKVGATAQEITQSIGAVNDDIQRFLLTGESSLMRFYNSMRAADPSFKLGKNPNENLLELARFAEGRDRAQMASMFGMMGLSPGTIQLLLEGRAAVKGYLDEFRRLAPTNKEIKESQELVAQYNTEIAKLESVARDATIALGPLARMVMTTLAANESWVSVFKILGEDLNDFGHQFDNWVNENWDKLDALTGGRLGKLGNSLFGPESFNQRFGSWETTAAGSQANRGRTSYDVAGVVDRSGGGRSGKVYAQAEEDIQAFMKMGWTREQATGIAANIHAESGGRTGAVGDGGQAFGLAQWHGDRQRAFREKYGKDIHEASRAEQREFINYEMRYGKEQAAGNALAAQQTKGGAAAVVAKMYERPGDAAGQAIYRARLAEGIATPSAGQVAAATSVPSVPLAAPPPAVDPIGAALSADRSSVDNSRSNSMHSETNIGKIDVITQAMDADSMARELKPAIERNNSFAQQANYGQN